MLKKGAPPRLEPCLYLHSQCSGISQGQSHRQVERDLPAVSSLALTCLITLACTKMSKKITLKCCWPWFGKNAPDNAYPLQGSMSVLPTAKAETL